MSSAEFRLSRVYAEGWNKARELSAANSDEADLARIAALNPYAADPEKSRWSDGFKTALGLDG